MLESYINVMRKKWDHLYFRRAVAIFLLKSFRKTNTSSENLRDYSRVDGADYLIIIMYQEKQNDRAYSTRNIILFVKSAEMPCISKNVLKSTTQN